MTHTNLDLRDVNQLLEGASPVDVLLWTRTTFGDAAVATSSFQSQSVPLLHMIGVHAREVLVYFLDTGFHFEETLAFRDQLQGRFGLRVRSVQTRQGHAAFSREHGDLHRRDPDACCYLNKVEPLERVLEGRRAWIAGIRRDQTEDRAGTPVVSLDRSGVFKICPLAAWTDRDVWRYIRAHSLPVHPLVEKGYASVGCAPCTRAVEPGAASRSGRWAETDKTECGLHLHRASSPEPGT